MSEKLARGIAISIWSRFWRSGTDAPPASAKDVGQVDRIEAVIAPHTALLEARIAELEAALEEAQVTIERLSGLVAIERDRLRETSKALQLHYKLTLGERLAKCPTCSGVGYVPETVPGDGGCRELSGGETVCPTCQGTGRACEEEA